MEWYQLKVAISGWAGLGMDALHVHAGLLLQIAAALLLRRSLASPLPWLVVLAAVLGNEWSDLNAEVWPNRDDQYAEAVKDVWNTLLLPTLLLVLCRWRPGLFAPSATPADAAAAAKDG